PRFPLPAVHRGGGVAGAGRHRRAERHRHQPGAVAARPGLPPAGALVRAVHRLRGGAGAGAAMTRPDEINRVAAQVGIVLRHVDALGVEHVPSTATLAQLLAALGLPERAAEPVLYLRPGTRSGPVEWRCRFEGGGEVGGAVALAPDGALTLPGGMPLGYHRLDLAIGGDSASLSLIVAPAACYLPPELGPGRRSWGLTAQLYGLRRAADWGIGDFTALAELAR